MYLLDAAADEIPALRETLRPLGDSLVVVGGEPTWNVHVHVDDVGAAVEAGIAAGRPHRIRVTHLLDNTGRGPGRRRPPRPTAAASSRWWPVPGSAGCSRRAGATVVPGGPGHRASTAELLDGAAAGRRARPDRAAQRRRQPRGRRGRGRPGPRRGAAGRRDPDQGQRPGARGARGARPERRFEDDVVHMTAAAGHCRHGEVTVAAREAVTMAGICHEGDVLGLARRRLRRCIGADLDAVACAVVDRMLGSAAASWSPWSPAPTPTDGLADAVVEHLHRDPARGRLAGLRRRPAALPAADRGGVIAAWSRLGTRAEERARRQDGQARWRRAGPEHGRRPAPALPPPLCRAR